MEKVYIFGHRNPDTDSVTAAITLSYLKNKLGMNTIPAVLSSINLESKFALNYFNIPEPIFLNDVNIKVKDLRYTKNYTVKEKDSIYEAYFRMNKVGISKIPVVDKDKNMLGILSMKDIAKDQFSFNYSYVDATYDNICEVIKGTPLLRFDDDINGNLLVASYKSTTFMEEVTLTNDNILIVGNRHIPKQTEPAFEGVEAVPLLRSPLTDYLAERSIPYVVASRYCCRLNYCVRGKRYFAVGFPNVAGGYEIRSRFFKGCVPPKDVSLVKAEGSPADVCSVFEGFMDFLSAATFGLEKGECLVLNSVANVEKAMRYLDGCGCIDCYLDHDAAGRRTLKTLKGHYGERVYDRSALYDGCKDLNEYLQLTTKKEQ